jgi:hypothetical protein
MRRFIGLTIFVIAFTTLIGCESDPAQTPAEISLVDETTAQSPAPTSAVQGTISHRWSEATPTVETEQVTPEPTATTEPTPIPTETSEIVASSSDECLACHMDQEQLMQTAAPEEKAPSESSGVG